MQQHGDTVAGKKIEIILKDDAAVPDNTKRLAQELIVNDKVNFIAGFGITPSALAAAPLATQAKVPEIVMAAGTSIITERSPYIVRTSFTLAQSSDHHRRLGGEERHQEGRDAGLGLCARRRRAEFLQGALHRRRRPGRRGGQGAARQSRLRAVPAAHEGCQARRASSCSCRPGQGGTFMKQYAERGLDKAGIKLIGPGDVTDDDLLNDMGDAVIGAVTAHLYSAAHPSAMNKDFVAAYKKAFNTSVRASWRSAAMTACT